MSTEIEAVVAEDFSCLVAEPLSVESRFGLRNCRPRGSDSHCDVELGPWSSTSDGEVQLGALGIAADHILGEVPFIRRPPGTWALTTELTLDFVAPIDSGANLHLWATPTRMEVGGGFAHGAMTNELGRVVAVCSTRTLFVPPTPVSGTVQRPAPVGNEKQEIPAMGIEEHLGIEYLGSGRDDAVRLRMSDPAVWQNGFGILHGGVWSCLAETAASRAISQKRRGLMTASVHTTYLRPGPSGAPVTVTARIQHVGSRLALVEVTGLSGDDTVCTISTVTARRATDLVA